MTTFDVTPLTGTLGAQIDGIDLRSDLSADLVAGLRRTLLEHRVIFFRGQDLAPGDLVRFGERFGPLTDAHPIHPGIGDHPEVLVIDSSTNPRARQRNAGARAYKWHTDVTFVDEPPLGSLLHAQVIPSRGGDTQWADTVDAYATLSAPLQRIVDDLVAVHDGRRVFGALAKADPTGAAQTRLDALPPVKHPVVRVHPETGERSLFVNPAFTSHLDGFDPHESEVILGLLYDHITQPERTVRWRWSVGDLAFWDNRTTAHYAITDYGDAHRRLQRITLAGDRPVGPAGVTPEAVALGA